MERPKLEQTLEVLAESKRINPRVLTKTSLILGLGETDAEIEETMDDLITKKVDILTLGQYLRPTLNHLPVERWVTPEEFDRYRDIGLAKGFLEVVSGPMVRSSYRAERALEKNNAMIMVKSSTTLKHVFERLIKSRQRRELFGTNAKNILDKKKNIISDYTKEIQPFICD